MKTQLNRLLSELLTLTDWIFLLRPTRRLQNDVEQWVPLCKFTECMQKSIIASAWTPNENRYGNFFYRQLASVWPVTVFLTSFNQLLLNWNFRAFSKNSFEIIMALLFLEYTAVSFLKKFFTCIS